jgi:hypothetical protein
MDQSIFEMLVLESVLIIIKYYLIFLKMSQFGNKNCCYAIGKINIKQGKKLENYIRLCYKMLRLYKMGER